MRTTHSVCTTKPELHGPPAYFTSGWAAAKSWVQKLAALVPFTVAVGHGRPLTGQGVGERLQALADAFDEVAVPDKIR